MAEVRAAHRQARDVQVEAAANMQGMMLGMDGAWTPWAAPMQKFLARACHVQGLGLAWSDRVLAYRMLAQSVLRFVGQSAPPGGGYLEQNRRQWRLLPGAPLHSMVLGIAERLSAIGACKDFASVKMLARAAQITLAVTNPDVCGYL